MRKQMVAFLFAILLAGFGRAWAQGPRQGGPGPDWGGDRGGDRVMGTVASVGVDRFTVKTQDGKTQVVLVGNETHFREGKTELQLEDLKPGDHVFVAGRMNSSQELSANMVGRVTKEQMERFGGEGERVFGEIIEIKGNQIRVRNPWQGERVVKIDDKTSFMKEGKDSELSELKKGDRIMALGKDVDGVFTATRIASGMMRGGGRRGGMGGGFPGGPEGGQPGSPSPRPE